MIQHNYTLSWSEKAKFLFSKRKRELLLEPTVLEDQIICFLILIQNYIFIRDGMCYQLIIFKCFDRHTHEKNSVWTFIKSCAQENNNITQK